MRTPQDSGSHTGNDLGVVDGRFRTLAEVLAHPADALAANDVVGVDHGLDSGNDGDVATYDDHGLRRNLAYHAAHLGHFSDVYDDR